MAAPVALAASGRAEARWRPALRGRLGAAASRSAVLLVILAAWQGASSLGLVSPFVLPSPAAILGRIWSEAASGTLWVNVAWTLYRALTGFVIASVLGVAIGVAMARIGVVRWFLDPLVSIAFPVPKIAFLPIFILWLGVHDVPKITMVVVDSVFPVIAATVAGLASVDRYLGWSARSMGARGLRLLVGVDLPAAAPSILTGMQVALPIALIVTIICEMLMGGYGLGGQMIAASRFADSTGVFAGIVQTALVGLLLIRSMAALRRRLLRWHPEASAPERA